MVTIGSGNTAISTLPAATAVLKSAGAAYVVSMVAFTLFLVSIYSRINLGFCAGQ